MKRYPPHPYHQGCRRHDLPGHVGRQARPRGTYPVCEVLLRQAGSSDEFPHLVAEGEGVFEIPVGPIHAGIIEPGHFRFSSVGETVLHLDARLFYTHRGLEKRMEGLSPLDAFYVAERICGVCSVAHGLGYAVMWSALTALLVLGSLLSIRLRVGYAVPSPAVSGAARG